MESTIDLSLLLPYWGLLFKPGSSEIKSGMKNKIVCIEGSDESTFQKLKSILQHTGVVLSSKPKENSDLDISVSIDQQATTPMTLHISNKTYSFKPLRTETEDLQNMIHKRIWLPVDSSRLIFQFTPYEKGHIPEWLGYIIIQHFLRASFQSVSHIPYVFYEHMVANVLTIINSNFAKFYMEEEKQMEEEWPQVPPELMQIREHPSKSLKKEDVRRKFDPFQNQQDTPIKHTINPFKFQNTTKRTSIINPFQNKH